MSRLGAAALDLAERGYAVFPCRPRDKRPITGNGFKAATRDERTILHWWDTTPDANIGIACGASGQSREAIQAATDARRDAVAEWGRVRSARRRLGYPPVGEVPIDDAAAILNAFDAAGRRAPWPGGKRPSEQQVSMSWRPGEWNQHWQLPVVRKTSLSATEAFEQIG